MRKGIAGNRKDMRLGMTSDDNDEFLLRVGR